MAIVVQHADLREFSGQPLSTGQRIVRAAVVYHQDFVRTRSAGEIFIPAGDCFFQFRADIERDQNGRDRQPGRLAPFPEFRTCNCPINGNFASPPGAVRVFPRHDRPCDKSLRGVPSSNEAANRVAQSGGMTKYTGKSRLPKCRGFPIRGWCPKVGPHGRPAHATPRGKRSQACRFGRESRVPITHKANALLSGDHPQIIYAPAQGVTSQEAHAEPRLTAPLSGIRSAQQPKNNAAPG